MNNAYQSIKFSKSLRSSAFILGAIALWVLLPFYFGADSTVSRAESFRPGLTAILSGSPVASVTPRGSANYQTFTANGVTTRSLSVQVSSVNYPAATVLQVSLNGASIGMITLNATRSGVLNLSTAQGGTVPMVVAGDTLAVKNGTADVLSGTFTAPATPSPTPTRTPSPSPSGSPSPSPSGTPIVRTRFYAPLTGTAIDGVIPRGIGEYEAVGTRTSFETYVNFVNLANGTVLSVTVNGVAVGNITLNNHRGELELRSAEGDTVPVVTNGSTVAVKNGATTVLAGTFTNTFPTPNGTPTPHPSPTGSPSPHPSPSPRVIRAFSSQLRGSSVVPPVTTEARGGGFIRLNTAETQITVHLRYFGLSSAATAVTINGPAMPTANGAVVFTLTNTGGTTGQAAQQTFDVTAQQVQQLRSGLLYFVVSTANNATGEIRGQIRPLGHRSDFDGDGSSEIAVLRPNTNSDFSWYILNSEDGQMTSETMGRTGDINVQGDYDGDGVTDVAMFTPSNGNWQIRRSATEATVNYRFGQQGDVPMVGDYDGDGRNDLAIFRPSAGSWYVWRSTDNSFVSIQFGTNGDKPISGDFDGDGISDFAVFRPSNGGWYVFQSSTGTMFAMQFGASTDRPVAGDFDGDGRSDVAVFRPSNGYWYISRSSDRGFTAMQFGQNGDIPIACEYDNDNRTDIAVFRPSNGYWYILRSSDNGLSAYQFGLGTDIPLPTVYAP
jgi:CHRD domain/FG-GAP-like repeat/FG-GAP repeat